MIRILLLVMVFLVVAQTAALAVAIALHAQPITIVIGAMSEIYALGCMAYCIKILVQD